jgi:hypothetical protein
VKNSLERQEVSGHEFTRAVKGFFSMCGFSRGEMFQNPDLKIDLKCGVFSKLFNRAEKHCKWEWSLAPEICFCFSIKACPQG